MTHASHFDGDTLTLTSPRGTLVLSQGQCASIVIMAEKHGPVGRVREAHQPIRIPDHIEIPHRGDCTPLSVADAAWIFTQGGGAKVLERLAALESVRPAQIQANPHHDHQMQIDALGGRIAALEARQTAKLTVLPHEQVDPQPALSRTDPPPTPDNAGRVAQVGDKQGDEAAVEKIKDIIGLETDDEMPLKQEYSLAIAIIAAIRRCASPLDVSRQALALASLFEENKTLRNDLAAMTERAEKAEADLAAERLKPKQHHNECLFCGTRFSAMYDKCPVCAARAETDALRVELDALKARKVKLPPSRVPLTDPQGHGDPYANGYSWGLLDCAAAIRAAGVEVEG